MNAVEIDRVTGAHERVPGPGNGKSLSSTRKKTNYQNDRESGVSMVLFGKYLREEKQWESPRKQWKLQKGDPARRPPGKEGSR